MTPTQVAANHAALRRAAERLEAAGWTDGDALAFAESLLTEAHNNGWRAVEKPVPLRGAAELGGAGYREFVEAKQALGQRRER